MIRGRLAGRVEELIAGRVPFVEATVVRAQHPTSVRAGDAALVLPDGTIEGFVGGVCAETSVRLHALRALETGEPLLLRLVPGDEDGLAQLPAAEGALTVRNPCLSGGALEIFLDPCPPASTIVVVGDSPVAQALGDIGRRLGFDVASPLAPEADISPSDAALVVASHGRDEERALAAALLAGVPYVGLVASTIRGEAVRSALDVPDELRIRLRTPAGLEIGARTPAEIALAILAEVVAERRGSATGRTRVPPADTATAPAVAIDPICGMEVAVSDASLHLDVDGERLYFCAERCQAAFAADPHERVGR